MCACDREEIMATFNLYITRHERQVHAGILEVLVSFPLPAVLRRLHFIGGQLQFCGQAGV